MIWLLLKNISARDYIIGGLILGLVYCMTMWHSDSVELKKTKLVYQNPQIKTVDRIVYKQGPVRTKTVIVKEKSGDEVTTIEEVRAPVEATNESTTDKTPISLAETMKPLRTDRYLVSVGLNRLSMDFDGKAMFVGYGFNNRLDVMVGAMNHDGVSPWALATFRF